MIHRITMLLFARNSSVESGKEGAVKTLIWLILIGGIGLAVVWSGSGPIDAVAEQSVVSPDDPSKPFYVPPKKYAPRARVGGELRGPDENSSQLVALVPDHVGMTRKQTPMLNWFLSKPTTYPIFFTLNDRQKVRPLYEGVLSASNQEGVHSIDLKTFGITLEPNIQYEWSVSMRPNPDSHSGDVVAGGMIERCEFADIVCTQNIILSCDESSVMINAKNGLWYDAMACICTLIDAKPADPSLRRLRAKLLKDVGLYGVAEWDLRSIQSALH
jgi:hypothetical protein